MVLVVGVVGLVWLVWRKKLTVTPEKENNNNNFGTARPARLVKTHTKEKNIYNVPAFLWQKEKKHSQ